MCCHVFSQWKFVAKEKSEELVPLLALVTRTMNLRVPTTDQ
jgi:hypothetical protein